ncbi:hypothetical protein PQQ81_09465 [Paraburkholderia strydomiana]
MTSPMMVDSLPNRLVPLRGPPLSHAFGAVPVRLDPGAAARAMRG